MLICTATQPDPESRSTNPLVHKCTLNIHLQTAAGYEHECDCSHRWTSSDPLVPEDDEPDDEPSTVESVREWLADAAETLDGLGSDLHALKRTVPEQHRESIMVAANGVGQAWAQARIALTALTDVVPRVATVEAPGTQGYM